MLLELDLTLYVSRSFNTRVSLSLLSCGYIEVEGSCAYKMRALAIK